MPIGFFWVSLKSIIRKLKQAEVQCGRWHEEASGVQFTVNKFVIFDGSWGEKNGLQFNHGVLWKM